MTKREFPLKISKQNHDEQNQNDEKKEKYELGYYVDPVWNYLN